MSSPAAVRVDGLRKAFGAVQAVAGIAFAVPSGQVLGLLGPSGCGKTTALRLVAGIERPDAGSVWLGERQVAGPDTYVPPERRHVGMVFQDYALFPHLNVTDNVAFGLPRGPERARRVADALALVGLEGLDRRWPHELSGGQQQRVALARALAPRPDVLLLDEPFSNLDATLRLRVRAEVRAILAAAGVTAIFVTHDREEALSLADAVAVMDAGRILQLAPPEELYQTPASPLVARAVGDADFLPADAQGLTADCELGAVPLAQDARGPVDLLVRPEAVALAPDPAGPATVVERQFVGPYQLITVRLPSGTVLRARTAPTIPLTVGAPVNVHLQPPLHAFPTSAPDGTPRPLSAAETPSTATPAAG
jgi:iron(III) transport system ATP-binding protein